MKVKRSVVDLNGRRIREVVAFQTQEDFKDLLKKLDAHPTREQYHATFEQLKKASLGYLWMPITLTTQDALGEEKEYQVTVPFQMLSERRYREYLVNYLALLLNIQEESRGLSTYSVKVWGKEDEKLLHDIDHKLKVDISLTKDRTLAVSPGGVSFNSINVNRTNKPVIVQFDQAQLNELMRGGFEGFVPVITNITRIKSPLQLFGVNPAKEPEVLAKA